MSLLEDCTFSWAILGKHWVASTGVTFFTDPVKYNNNSETSELKKHQMINKMINKTTGLWSYDANLINQIIKWDLIIPCNCYFTFYNWIVFHYLDFFFINLVSFFAIYCLHR